MNLDLGQYQFEVLSAYAVTVILLIALAALVLYNSRKTARQLEQLRNGMDAGAD